MLSITKSFIPGQSCMLDIIWILIFKRINFFNKDRHIFVPYIVWSIGIFPWQALFRCKHFMLLVRYILSNVCLWLSHFSQLSFMQYVGLCVFSFPIYLMIIVRICVLYLIIIIKLEVWLICHCLRLDHEIMVCAVCLSIFFWMVPWIKQHSCNRCCWSWCL